MPDFRGWKVDGDMNTVLSNFPRDSVYRLLRTVFIIHMVIFSASLLSYVGFGPVMHEFGLTNWHDINYEPYHKYIEIDCYNNSTSDNPLCFYVNDLEMVFLKRIYLGIWNGVMPMFGLLFILPQLFFWRDVCGHPAVAVVSLLICITAFIMEEKNKVEWERKNKNLDQDPSLVQQQPSNDVTKKTE